MHENELAKIVVDVVLQIHRKLGPGLFESVYHAVLVHELKKRNLIVESQVPIPVEWDGVRLDVGFVADIIVNGKLMLELKSVEQMNRVYKKQLLTHLRSTNRRLGLLANQFR